MSPAPTSGERFAQDVATALIRREWSQIKGLQLEGRVVELQGDEEKRAQRIYGEKFPIVGAAPNVPPAIVKTLAKVRWFRLVPERVVFINNSKGFGHGDEIDVGCG